MQEALLSPLATWHNFYSIIGSAAATLTGLLFVVITLIAGVRVRVSARCWSPRFSVRPGRRSGLLACCWALRVLGERPM